MNACMYIIMHINLQPILLTSSACHLAWLGPFLLLYSDNYNFNTAINEKQNDCNNYVAVDKL